MILLLLMSVTACGTTSTGSRTIPKEIVPSVYERKVMRELIPEFYIKFTNQQRDIMAAR